MNIRFKIFKWTIIELSIMCPDGEDTFYYFGIDLFGFGLWFWNWEGISRLVVSFYIGHFIMREKYLTDWGK